MADEELLRTVTVCLNGQEIPRNHPMRCRAGHRLKSVSRVTLDHDTWRMTCVCGEENLLTRRKNGEHHPGGVQ